MPGFYYTVSSGDTLSKIAKTHGVTDWRLIYNHEKNKDFKKKHPNPNLIYAGDVVWIPGAEANKTKKKTGHKFKITIPKFSIIRIRLGETDESKCEITKPDKELGAVYIPTKLSGTFYCTFPSSRNVKLYYSDGTFPDNVKKVVLLKEMAEGKHEQTPFLKNVSGTDNIWYWKIGGSKHGWYFLKVDGSGAVAVKNKFFLKHSLPDEPWSGYWWPFLEDAHPQITTPLRMWLVDGPLDKYDIFCGHKWPPDNTHSARAWEYDLKNGHRIAGNAAGWWFGHCDGVAAAGCEVKLPSSTKTVRGVNGDVEFSKTDIQGLAAERWMLPNTPNSYEFDWYWSSRRKDPVFTARNFFELIVKRLSPAQNKACLMDCFDGPDQVWNYPVFKFEARFSAGGTTNGDEMKIVVEMELYHKSGSSVESQVSKLEITFDHLGSTTGDGLWDTGSFRPKNVFYPKRTVQPSNDKVDIAKADRILS